MKKKVLIVYATYGNGHKMVANYIEDGFKRKDNNLEIETIDILDYSSPFIKVASKKLFEKTMFSKIPIIWELAYKWYNNKYRSIGTKKLCYQLYDKKSLRKKIEQFNPDIVISTHYFGSMLMEKYKRDKLINSKLYTLITDYELHEFWIKAVHSEEAIIVSNNEMKDEIVKKNIPKEKIKVFGIPVSQSFSLDLDSDDLKRKFKLDSKPTVLFFGGGNNSKSSLGFFKTLLRYDKDFNIIFIAGNNLKLKNKVNELVKREKCKNIKVLGYVKNVYEYMAASDLVISKPGGLTVSECIFLRKPMLIINHNAGQEKGNYKYLVKKKYAFKASTTRKFNFYLRLIKLNPKILNMMSKRMISKKETALNQLFKLVMK